MISVVLHLLLAVGAVSLKPVLSRFTPREKEPVVVDVVDLPAGPSSPALPRKSSHYADRSQTVDKETYPEPSKKPALRSLPSPLAGSKGGGKETAAAAKGTGSEMKRPGGSLPKESAGVKKEDTVKAASKVAPKASFDDKKAEDVYRSISKTQDTAPAEEGGANGRAHSGALKSAETAIEAHGGSKEGAAAKPARPNLFPTPERITELEKRYEAEAPLGEKGKTLQLNTSELRYQKYLMNMKRRIEFYWEYPEVASRSGWQGVLNINFTINKDGTVSNITVGKSSNYPVLDDAAVTAIRLAAPFPPFPENFGIEEISIKGQFEYKIYGGPQGGG
ncbi:MAG: TonB family protein [Deltaproteobacteria bacterium]|nr:TonB family protein [Deltaproteobacteria bacterium]